MTVMVNPYEHLTGANTPIGVYLGDEPAGLALDFVSMQGLVRGHTTNFLGDPNALLTYASPSTKWITNGFGILASGTTLRCDHDPATLDTSTSALNSLGIGGGAIVQKTLTIAGTVDYRRGPQWVTATAYVIGSVIKNGLYSYSCRANHTSAASTEPGVGASWQANWSITEGNDVRATDAGNIANWMVGKVASFDVATKILVLNVYAASGYFAASSWKVIVALGVLIEEQRTNLLLRSSEFDNAVWAKDGITVTPNTTTAPDGSLTADTFTKTVAFINKTVTQLGVTVANATAHAFSCLFKAGTLNFAGLTVISGGNDARCWLDLSTGAVGVASSTGLVSSSSKYVGNGWWRFVIVVTSASTSANVYTYAGKNDGIDSALGTVFAWGAQFEAGAFATSTIPTTTAQVTRAADIVYAPISSLPFLPPTGTVKCEFATSLTFDSGVQINLFSVQNTNNNRFIVARNDSAAFDRHLTLDTYNGSAFGPGGPAGLTTDFPSYAGGKLAVAYTTNDLAVAIDGAIKFTYGSAYSYVFGTSAATQFNIGSYATTPSASKWMKRIAYLPRRAVNNELQAMTA